MNLVTVRRFIILVGGLVLLIGGALLYLEQFLRLDTHRERIVTELGTLLHRKVSYRTGEFTFRYGPSFTFTGVTVSERDGRADFLRADRLILRIAILPLLEKKVIIRSLDLDAPRITLTRYRDGTFSVSDLLEQRPSAVSLQIRGLRMRGGTVNFTDLKASAGGLRLLLSGAELTARRLSRGKKGSISFAAALSDGERSCGALALSGKVALAPAGTELARSGLDLELTTAGLDTSAFWPYYRDRVPFKKVEGRLTTRSSFKGELTRFTAGGSFSITGGRFDYQPVFHAVLEPKSVGVTYTLNVSRDEVNVSSLDVVLDGVRIRGSCAIRDLTSGDPRIVARATSTPIRLEEFARYIPYGVIVTEPSEFIEQKIRGGTVRIREGTVLDGRVSQILTMEKGTNYNVLAVRGTIEKGIVAWGDGWPLITDIRGELELAGKDFNLKKMSGRFGSSPFTLEGALRDYPVVTPTLYHFTMTTTPSPADVAWLFRIGRETPAGLTGRSVLTLAGDGPSKNYTLSGTWDLGQAAYTIPGVIAKPAGMANTASFRFELTPERTLLREAQYLLPPLAARGAASYGATQPGELGFSLATNQFSLNDLAPLAPRLARYRPRGNVQLTLRGTRPADPDRPLTLAGTVSLAGVSLHPFGGMKPLTELNGSATFTGTGLETSYMTAKLGSTSLFGKVTLRDFADPVATVAFSSPLVDPADLGLKSTGREFRPSRVQGHITLQEQSLRIDSLATQINNTRLAVTGTIKELRRPRVSLAITAPYLELDDILALARLEPAEPSGGKQERPPLTASLSAEAGKLKGIPFDRLKAEIIYEDGILYLQPLEFQTLGGSITSKVRADTASGSAPRYQLNYELRRISSQELLKSLGVKKQEVWGTLSAQGDLTARGETADELQKSLLGALSFQIENGSIRRFASLAKIFSILNVSQLLKMRLPEMTAGGMPFSSVTGSVAIRDGVFSTSDLFVRSEAMNISAVGSLDLPRNRLDLIVGVQPLQSVDKVVNRIPIVGWILTGKESSWITSYFQVTGPPGDPEVSVKTVSTMATGVLNVFKRLFQLPAKLFTDTGEVILGQ